jgi:hypothetical protein
MCCRPTSAASRRGRPVRNLTTGQLLEPREGQDDFYLEHPEAGTSVDTATRRPDRILIAGVAGVSTQVAAAGVALEACRTTRSTSTCRSSSKGSTTPASTPRRVHAERRGRRRRWHLEAGAELQQELAAEHQRADIGADTERGAVAYTSSRGNVTLRSSVDHVTVYQKLLPYESLREHYTLTSGARRKPSNDRHPDHSAAATPRERCGPGADDVGAGRL